jgi:predicted Zn-dependent peptidase
VRKAAEGRFARPRYVATAVGPSSGASATPDRPRGGTTAGTALENGLRLVTREEAGSDVLAVHVIAGHPADQEPDGRGGLADCLSRMMLRGTTTRDRETLAADLAAIGANLTVVDNPWIPYDDYYTSRRYAFIRFEVLAEYWRPGLEILADIIRNPALDPEEVEGVRGEMLSLIDQRDQTTYKTARRLFYRALFGEHPFARPILGTGEEVGRLSVADLKWLHEVLYAPNNLVFAAVGGVPADSVRAAFTELFGDMPRVEMPAEFPRAPEKRRQLKNVEERMGKEQAYITMGDLLPGAGDEDVPAIRMMIAILSERLAKELREKDGLAYSIGASAQFARGFGWYTISMGTERSNYRRAVDGIRREINRLRSERVGEEELRESIRRTRGRAQMKRLSSINRAYFLGLNEFLLGDFRESEAGLERLKDVRVEDVRRVARAYLHTGEGVLVAVR